MTTDEGLVYKGHRQVIPTKERANIVNSLHESHIGIEGTLQRGFDRCKVPSFAQQRGLIGTKFLFFPQQRGFDWYEAKFYVSPSEAQNSYRTAIQLFYMGTDTGLSFIHALPLTCFAASFQVCILRNEILYWYFCRNLLDITSLYLSVIRNV